MPADKKRKMVVLRLLPEDVDRLEALAVKRTHELGRIVHRSEALSLLLRASIERTNGRRQATGRRVALTE